MEAAIQTLVKIYLKSSKGKENLSKKDFQNLVKSQLGNILSDTDSNDAINNMAKGLDENQDNKLGFEEYMKLVGYCAVSLSEQRSLAKEEPAQNAASGQVAQSSPDKEEKPEANSKAKEETTEEVKEEATAEAAAEVKVEASVAPAAEAEVKAEGEALPEVTEETTAAAEVVVTTTTTVVEVKEEVKVEETVKEEAPAAEGKTEETTS